LVGGSSLRPSRKRRGRSDIRLTGAEEHRCPYCLTPVIDGDPRGVVICPVCHTPHHADCWAVTGACQVPHAYASPT
jgi:ribosomal protein L37AE/L43A